MCVSSIVDIFLCPYNQTTLNEIENTFETSLGFRKYGRRGVRFLSNILMFLILLWLLRKCPWTKVDCDFLRTHPFLTVVFGHLENNANLIYC